MYNKLHIIVFKHTDLPDPVVPAIKRWGILARFNVEISPEVVFPIANVSSPSDSANFSEFIIDRKIQYQDLYLEFQSLLMTYQVLEQ